jgi:hypothetical protein
VLSMGGTGSVLSLGGVRKGPDIVPAAFLRAMPPIDVSRISARLRSRAKGMDASRLPRRVRSAMRRAVA